MAKASELNKFTKDEIIQALSSEFDLREEYYNDNTISRLISFIKYERSLKRQKEHMKILNEENTAMNNYFDFGKQMQEKYGDEKGFLLGDLTPQELGQLASLRGKWDNLRKQEAGIEAEERKEIKKILKE